MRTPSAKPKSSTPMKKKNGAAAKKEPNQGPTLPMQTPDPGSKTLIDDHQIATTKD